MKKRHITWVWRKRGSNSPESLCKFASFAPVRAAVEAPPAPSPCPKVARAPTKQTVKTGAVKIDKPAANPKAPQPISADVTPP